MIKSYNTINKDNFNNIKFNTRSMKNRKQGLSLDTKKNITAFDFETLTHRGESKPVMLGIASVDTNGNIIENRQTKPHVIDEFNGLKWYDNKVNKRMILESILTSVTSYSYRSDTSINFFYNMKYDLGMIVSLMTGDEIERLYKTDNVPLTFNGITYNIDIVGAKMLIISIDDGNKRRKWEFYDLLNFTKSSLANACHEWNISEFKQEDFETAKVFNDKKLMLEVYDKAVKYCVQDVRSTALLGYSVKSKYEEMGFPFSRPISTASLFKAYMGYNELSYPSINGLYTSKEYLEEKLEDDDLSEGYKKKIKGAINKSDKIMKMQKLSWEGYYGGLFEMYKRGHFKDVMGFDYDSMYPAIMINLPNYDECEIYDLETVDKTLWDKHIKRCQWAVVRVKVWISEDAKICPFPVKATMSNGSKKLIRPIMRGQEVTMSKQFYDWFINDYPHYEKHEIVSGFVIYEKGLNTKRVFDFVEDLFKYRVELVKKYGKEDKRQLVLKEVYNAGYGVTAETIDVDEWEYDKGRLWFNDRYIKAGRMFRPFYAFHITEHARLKMYKDIFNNDLENEVIGVATDCIFIDGKGKDKMLASPNYYEGKKLGTLSVDYEGEMVIIGNGVYQVRDKSGYVSKTTRGFNGKDFPNLYELSDATELKSLEVTSKQPLSWRIVALSLTNSIPKNIAEINVFKLQSKVCNLNMDNSRIWNGEFNTVAELFSKQLDSRPYKLEEV